MSAIREALQKKVDSLLDMITPEDRDEKIQKALQSQMVEDFQLQGVLVDIVARLKKKKEEKPMDAVDRHRAIFLTINADAARYESFFGVISSLEFMTFLARKAVDQERLTALEYAQFRDMLKKMRFSTLNLCKYQGALGSRYEQIDKTLHAKEMARRALLAKFSGDSEVMEQIAVLGLDKPIITPKEVVVEDKIAQKQLYDLIDEYCRFLALAEGGMIHHNNIMLFILNYLGIIPHLNGGYALLETVERKEGEGEKEFEERVEGLTSDILRRLIQDLDKHPEINRLGLTVGRYGELNVTGVMPTTNLKVLEKKPEVQGLIGNIRKTADSQIEQ